MTFGAGSSSTLVILVMFVCILLGVAARYIFYLEGRFSWLDFVKPLRISPILPLIVCAELRKVSKAFKWFPFGLRVFQNGFLWQAVLAEARPKTLSTAPNPADK